MTRRLKPEDLELWTQVAKTAEPLHPKKLVKIADLPKTAKTPNKTPEAPKPLPVFKIGTQGKKTETRDISPALGIQLRNAPVQMDQRSYKNMQRGKLKPEGRIDLHGMTLAQAHPALSSFILSAQRSGKRLVLVITGKGGRREDPDTMAPQRMGALKRQVPHWLVQPPLNSVVLQVTEAHLRHGGSGAYYVYLRRTR